VTVGGVLAAIALFSLWRGHVVRPEAAGSLWLPFSKRVRDPKHHERMF
jgi:hypothetical protein